VVYAAESSPESDARKDARLRAQAAGVTIRPLPSDDKAAATATAGAAVALDGLFGTGARLPIGDAYQAAARALRGRGAPVVAIDIPSGIDTDSGAACDNAVRATSTIALAALKPGLLLDPAREHCGDIWVADIGIEETTLRECARTYAALDDNAFLDLLPVRAPESDKRSAGAPLVIAGSEQFPGAAVLCARGAARAGAGYVTVATPAPAAAALRAHLVEEVVVTFAHGSPIDAAEDLLDIAQRNSSVAVGPGLSLDEWTGAMLRHFLERIDLPIVADASALFHLTKSLEVLRNKKCVLTPHAGEFARLSGKGTIAPGDRVNRLREFVERTGVTTLLKGNATLIYDGSRVDINTTGTQALATAGTGDVLTGIISTLLSQGVSPFDAARAGAYWHGKAGRLCAARRRVGVLSGDLPDALGDAIPAHQPPAPLRRLVPQP
ncbi:MAG TPA: NAD(P)H-hydrate dehydratase, partial [Candidatus Baltobacteraceae bacterium]|nr:NAD(P)H-hydrate dehydratase [Candidatus Baltobacteraceae bacterium]